ncbi:signal recognition particle protein [Leptolinea tardivitalis]|uniref:Signal recognition particle protein n=1 Tax=Leptolinea tardivitalis TaxID=229920 RepID=A0A0N8GL99_9CHLR|nr:signal recognition particle protein [Leptolinea tardivitalis]KPL71906.1 signal recognition particle [Leptolinea tardivitalis]GAP20317.1 signal recognition particle subunit FFH/SRP54 [Leptolinea tardivitalis]
MFESLTDRLNQVFTQLRRRGKLSEADVDAALREVRLALLDADVHYSVVKKFTAGVRERAVGAEVSRALNPAQQVIKIVHEELISTLGEPERLNLTGEKPRVIMLVGLQGSGKTTAAAKLARLLRSQGERVLLAAADPYRPAAVQQLVTLGGTVGVEVFTDSRLNPPELVQKAYEQGIKGGYSILIADTAGRSQMDDTLMDELKAITRKVKPADILLVVDSMVGQEALHIAEGFRDTVTLTGLILTKMDGDARGGAAISIRSVTGVPIKFLGVGEGIDALEVYDPRRLASRILGMGDVIGLIEKAEAAFDLEGTQNQAARMMSGKFSLEDFAAQMKQIRKMGPISQIFDMLPGNLGKVAQQVSPQDAEKQLKLTEAIISSMTREERREPDILNASRRRRIARGSGVDVQDVNRVMKNFREAQKLMKTLQKTGGRGLPKIFG